MHEQSQVFAGMNVIKTNTRIQDVEYFCFRDGVNFWYYCKIRSEKEDIRIVWLRDSFMFMSSGGGISRHDLEYPKEEYFYPVLNLFGRDTMSLNSDKSGKKLSREILLENGNIVLRESVEYGKTGVPSVFRLEKKGIDQAYRLKNHHIIKELRFSDSLSEKKKTEIIGLYNLFHSEYSGEPSSGKSKLFQRFNEKLTAEELLPNTINLELSGLNGSVTFKDLIQRKRLTMLVFAGRNHANDSNLRAMEQLRSQVDTQYVAVVGVFAVERNSDPVKGENLYFLDIKEGKEKEMEDFFVGILVSNEGRIIGGLESAISVEEDYGISVVDLIWAAIWMELY